ncbi:MAG: PAS domain-containing sensor histidine kinase [Sulfuricurvum sp.]|nr:PAS domain-containing sensor histidine kinase [Sulfuricurvum sp.]
MQSELLVLKEQLKARLRSDDPEYRYYKTIFNSTGDMIAVTDGDVIFDANTSFLNFFESNIKDSLESCHFPSLLEKVEKFGYVYEGYQNRHWFDTILEGTKEHYRIGVIKNGILHTFNITLKRLEPLNNIYIATLTNITEMMGYKTVLEEGIRHSVEDRNKTQFLLAQYDKAIEAATLVFKCDVSGIITYANKALSEVLLYGKGELIGQHFSVLRGKSIRDEVYFSIWESVRGGKIYKGTLEIADKVGGSHYLDVSFIPIHDQEKEVVEFFSLSHEITDVMEAKEMAVKTLEAKNKFFDQVSHELRTPLNAIINFTDQALENFEEMFEDDESRELVKMYIKRAYKNSQSLLYLINSLLDMAKLKSGKETFSLGQHDAVALIRETHENCSSLHKNTNLEYRLKINVSMVPIECDPLKFRQVLTNLISNAFKFTKTGFVELSVEEMADEYWIMVEDSGTGIPPEKLSTIFEPFEQVSNQDQGTGLGLSIVYEYCKGMGLRLQCESTLCEGTRFIVIAQKLTPKEGSEWIL